MITSDHGTALAVAHGRASLAEAEAAGALTITGDRETAVRFLGLFPPPRARRGIVRSRRWWPNRRLASIRRRPRSWGSGSLRSGRASPSSSTAVRRAGSTSSGWRRAGPPATLGRSPECDVSLPWDREVSRLHAELAHVGDQWVLVDDGLSSNGTFLGDERISGRRRLADGDVFRVGATAIAFRNPTGRGTRDDARPSSRRPPSRSPRRSGAS